MSQTASRTNTTTDEWAIDTVEVPVPEKHRVPRGPMLVDLPCPPPVPTTPEPNAFECEVMETAELARYMRESPRSIRARARRYAWGIAAAAVVTVGTVAAPVVIWFGTVPIAIAAGFVRQWAVLSAAANRLERDRDGA